MINTVLIIAEQALLYVPLAAGAYLTIGLMKIPDLSLESAFAFGAIIAYQTLKYAGAVGPQPLVLLIVLIAAAVGGMIVGMTTATLTRKLGFPHLLSAIITIGLFHGINQVVLGTAHASFHLLANPLHATTLGTMHPELLALSIIGLIVTGLLACILMTQMGYCFAIYGRNNRFFDNHGIDEERVFTHGILLANGLAGISGYLVAQSNGFVDITMGLGVPLLAITALILGKTTTSRRPINSLIPVIGIFAYFVIQQLLLKVGFNLKFFTAVQATIVLLVLAYHYHYQPRHADDQLGV